MEVLKSFIIGVLVGFVVYVISTQVPFLEAYASLLGFLAFLAAAYLSSRHRRL